MAQPSPISPTQSIPLIAVDWGTSNFRSYAVSATGQILDQRESQAGLLNIDDGNFQAVLRHHCADWFRADEKQTVLMAGMVGAQTGWREAPYAACPASARDLSLTLTSVPNDLNLDIRIIPGLCCRNSAGEPDIMRGEETLLMGLVSKDPDFQGTVILPGTHSKHAYVADHAVHGFSTAMTGEVFALLSEQSILRLTVDSAAAIPSSGQDPFLAAVEIASATPEKLLQSLFKVRSRAVVDGQSPGVGAAHLSGLLIGAEIALLDRATPVAVIADPKMASLYLRALQQLGIEAIQFDPAELLLAGLKAIEVHL